MQPGRRAEPVEALPGCTVAGTALGSRSRVALSSAPAPSILSQSDREGCTNFAGTGAGEYEAHPLDQLEPRAGLEIRHG